MKNKNRIWIYTLLLIGVFPMLTSSCKKVTDNNDLIQIENSVSDIDGNIYHTVTIGTQVWMVENLNTTKYRNGSTIPNVSDITQWSNLTTGAQCTYNNDIANGNKYGKLYNWHAVNDSRSIAPTGWHVPTDAEWTTLENYVAVNFSNSGSIAKALASVTEWSSSTDSGAIGNDLTKNNTSGFKALPGGDRFGSGGSFSFIGSNGFWWSSTASNNSAWCRYLGYNVSQVYRIISDRQAGFSVRCIRD